MMAPILENEQGRMQPGSDWRRARVAAHRLAAAVADHMYPVLLFRETFKGLEFLIVEERVSDLYWTGAGIHL